MNALQTLGASASHALLPAIGIMLLIMIFFFVVVRGGARQPALKAKPVLTTYELAFYHHLLPIVRRIDPDLLVFAQVAMGGIIATRSGMDAKETYALRNRFDRKIIDFAITDAATNVVLIVELDDRTHNAERDRARDAITAAAGYRTLRLRGTEARDARRIEAAIRQAMSASS